MAPMLNQESIDLSFMDDFTQMFDPADTSISFEEIASLAETENFTDYDNTKLIENNGVGVDLPAAPCAVIVQPATPNPTQTLHLDPASSEMFLLQPVSPGTSIESAPSPYSIQSTTPDPDYLQPVTPDQSMLQPATPDLLYSVPQFSEVACSPQPSSLDSVVLQAAPLSSVEPVLSSYSVQVVEEATPVQSTVEVADAPKKRGRKRKYPEGTAPRRNRPKKPKVYEMGPLLDEKAERKRKNAVNAKLHREMKKLERDTLAIQLEAVTAERDSLLKRVQQLIQNEAQLRLRLANQEQKGLSLL